MKRRDLLRAAAALPGLYVLGCSRAPSWFNEALARMRSEGKPGLVLRLPADPKLRCRYGHSLWWLMEDDEASSVEISRQAVFLCLEDEATRALLSGARDGEDLLLIDPDGVVLDGRRLDDPIGLSAAAVELLDGPKLARLRARAGTNPVSRLVLQHKETVDAKLEDEISALAKAGPAPLPYGASIQAGVMRCAENKDCTHGTCGACGLAVMTAGSREFVKFLVK